MIMPSLRTAGSVHREVGLLHRLRSADVGSRQRHTDDELSDGLEGVRVRDRVQHVARQYVRPHVALHVDDRRFAGDRHRFFDGADTHVGVDRRGEVRGELHPFLLHRRKTGKAEREDVHAGAEVLDFVSAVRVGCRGPDLLDQRRAGGFDRHSGQDGAGRVSHNARKRALGARQAGYGQYCRRDGHRCQDPSRHAHPPRQSPDSGRVQSR